jgi:2'-5' RNA ligase
VSALRAFIALPVPGDVRRHLGRLHESVPPAAGRITWVKPEAIHLTCLFLGDVPAERVVPMGEALREAVAEIPAFETALGEVGAFPDFRRPRVVWIGLERGAEAAVALKERIEPALVPHGFTPEDRPYHPHITLGRVRTDGKVRELEHAAAHWVLPFEHWMSGEAVLYRSELTRNGPVYTPLVHAPLLCTNHG